MATPQSPRSARWGRQGPGERAVLQRLEHQFALVLLGDAPEGEGFGLLGVFAVLNRHVHAGVALDMVRGGGGGGGWMRGMGTTQVQGWDVRTLPTLCRVWRGGPQGGARLLGGFPVWAATAAA